jgi:hypothetical protein
MEIHVGRAIKNKTWRYVEPEVRRTSVLIRYLESACPPNLGSSNLAVELVVSLLGYAKPYITGSQLS